MKTRIWCKKHKRWHSKHAASHCRLGFCMRPAQGRGECPWRKR